jgi:CBS domain-containing protein
MYVGMMPSAVKDIMIRNVRTIDVEDTVLDAVSKMNRHEIGCVVVTEKDKPVGILTERDILKRIVPRGMDPTSTKAHSVMSKTLVTTRPESEITQAAQVMLKGNIKKLVVVNDGSLVGIVSLTDLLPILASEGALDRLCLNRASSHVKKAFQIYYDPVRQRRKTCPLTMMGGSAISCLGSKCMWFSTDRCILLNMAGKNSS